jgi:hypothetical protein
MRQLLVTANSVSSSPILVTLMMEELHSSVMSVLTRPTCRTIPEDSILHSHHHENLKSYMKTLINTSKEVDLEANAGKTKYILLSHHQNAGKYDKRSANIIFVTLEQFKYF